MAVTESKEVVIEASPEDILDVIADVESGPEWVSAQQSAEVVDRDADGRPHQVKMKIKTAGVRDDLVIEYTWSPDAVRSSLVSARQLKRQDGLHALSPEGDNTRVRFELTVDPLVPIPGFVLRRALKGAVNDNTDGLRKRVLRVKKGG